MTMTVTQAIERSITHDEIVTIDHTPENASELAGLCDDSADLTVTYGRPAAEYWGRDDDGAEWRVHLDSPEPEPGAEADRD